MTPAYSPYRDALIFVLPYAEWLMSIERLSLGHAIRSGNVRELRAYARLFTCWAAETRRWVRTRAVPIEAFVHRARALAWIAWMIRRLAREMAS